MIVGAGVRLAYVFLGGLTCVGGNREEEAVGITGWEVGIFLGTPKFATG